MKPERADYDRLVESLADGVPLDWAALGAQGIDRARSAAVQELATGGAHRRDSSHDRTRAGRRRSGGCCTSPTGRFHRLTAWGHLEIVKRLAVGSFGELYLAHDPQLNRDVALKLLRRGMSNNPSAARLLAEAQTIAKVRHPNVVTIHGADVREGRAGLVDGAGERPDARDVAPGQRRPGRGRGGRYRPGPLPGPCCGSRSRTDSRGREGPERHARRGRADRSDGLRRRPGRRGLQLRRPARPFTSRPKFWPARHRPLRAISTALASSSSTSSRTVIPATPPTSTACVRHMRRASASDSAICARISTLVSLTSWSARSSRIRRMRFATAGTMEQALAAETHRRHVADAAARFAAAALVVARSSALPYLSRAVWGPKIQSVAVLPFTSPSGDDSAHLLSGLSSDVVRELQRFDLEVKRAPSAAAGADPAVIERRVGTEAVLHGVSSRADGTATLRVAVVHAGASELWSKVVSARKRDAAVPRANDFAGCRVSAAGRRPQGRPRARASGHLRGVRRVSARARAVGAARSQPAWSEACEYFKQAAQARSGICAAMGRNGRCLHRDGCSGIRHTDTARDPAPCQGRGAQGDRARSEPGRGAYVAGVHGVPARLGLGRGRSRASNRRSN